MSDVALDSVVAKVLAEVFGFEGGVADMGDGAGLTRWGQTEAWLQQWRLPVPTSKDEAAMNYRHWLEATELDALCTVDDRLAPTVIDFAVNSGERVAIASLQRALGVTADGAIGPRTLTALALADRSHLAHHVLADRLELDNAMIGAHPDQYARFAHGWGSRLAEQIRRLA